MGHRSKSKSHECDCDNCRKKRHHHRHERKKEDCCCVAALANAYMFNSGGGESEVPSGARATLASGGSASGIDVASSNEEGAGTQFCVCQTGVYAFDWRVVGTTELDDSTSEAAPIVFELVRGAPPQAFALPGTRAAGPGAIEPDVQQVASLSGTVLLAKGDCVSLRNVSGTAVTLDAGADGAVDASLRLILIEEREDCGSPCLSPCSDPCDPCR